MFREVDKMRMSPESMPKAIKQNKIFVVVDIETSGYSPKKGAEILQLGACLIDAEEKKIKKSFFTHVKPINGPVPAKITELTHITQADVENAPPLKTVILAFERFIGEYPLAFHNAAFDWDRFLDVAFKKYGKVKENPIVDTLEIAKFLYGVKGNNLDALREKFSIPLDGHHNALIDAKHTAIILTHMRELLPENGSFLDVEATKREIVVPDLKIGKYTYWEKRINAKLTHRRIYVSSNWGQMYYDINQKAWCVQKAKYDKSIDFRFFEKAFLHFAKVDSLEVLINTVIGENQ